MIQDLIGTGAQMAVTRPRIKHPDKFAPVKIKIGTMNMADPTDLGGTLSINRGLVT